MPITSINGFVTRYNLEDVKRLLNFSNFNGNVQNTTEYVYFPNPTQLFKYGIDHSQRPYRIFVLKDGLIIPEFFSFDLEHWNSTYYKKLFDLNSNIKKVIIQGVNRCYELLEDGTILITPPMMMNPSPLTVVFNNSKVMFENVFKNMKYSVEATSMGPANFMGSIVHNSVNRGVNIGWRTILFNKYDLSVLLFISALEEGISFKVMLSDIISKEIINTDQKFVGEKNLLLINSRDKK